MKARFELNKYRLYTNMMRHVDSSMYTYNANIIQLLDETEQNIVIYQWRADQLFADAEGRGK